jgi:hypothetical protein
MSLNLLEVVAAVRARRASLSAETVGYLLLGVADQVIAVPRELGAEDVFLGEEGAVRLGAGKAADSERSERALRELLDALLGVASTATPALGRIGRRPSGVGIDGFLRELEVALIPVNRSAARRALNRLYRDAQRAAQGMALDVAAAQAWLRRTPPPSAPTPAVVVVQSSAPTPVPLALQESPVVAFEVTPSRPSALSRPPPLPDQQPVIETLTRPEPVLVRAAARARSEPPPLPVLEPEIEPGPAIPELVPGTPRLGTLVAPVVHSVPAEFFEPVLELATDDATERTPNVATEPPAITVTAPMPPCADVKPPEIDDEIMIVVDSELTPVPEEDVAFESEGAWWSSPEPPAQAALEPERAEPELAVAPVAAALPPPLPALPAFELPSPFAVSLVKTAPLPAVELRAPEPEPLSFDDAALEAAAAEYRAIVAAPPSEPGARAEEDPDYAERGWTPAPEPISPPVATTPEPPPQPAPSRFPPRRSDVSELLRGFAVTEVRTERELCRDLKLLAGVDLTPLPGTGTLR